MRRQALPWTTLSCLFLFATACKETDNPAATGTTDAGTGEASGGMGPGSPPASTTPGTMTTGADGNTSSNPSSSTAGFDTAGGAGTDTGASFIVEPDGGNTNIACDVWSQDCEPGQKCMPFDATGSGAWNGTKCIDIVTDSKAGGDECKVEGTRHSGIDNCGLSLMCFNVDEKTLVGTCMPFCEGSPDDPVCSEPGTTCAITNQGTITLCLDNCDPLNPECTGNTACYPVGGIFQCAATRAAPGGGNFGDPCEYLNSCSSGLFCGNGARVPGCMSPQCCTTWCDMGEFKKDPQSVCQQDGVMGLTCNPFYPDAAAAPAGRENVGACLLPA